MNANRTINLPPIHHEIGGRLEVRVMQVTKKAPDGTPLEWHQVGETRKSKNLILPANRTGTFAWGTHLSTAPYVTPYAHVGTGSTPNKVLLDGTFEQTGTTVTRSTGAGVFVNGNAGDFIKFASGQIAKIVTYTNPLTVTVDRSQTVAAAALTVYDTSRIILDTWVKSSSTRDAAVGADGATQASDTGITTKWITINQTVETSPRTYTEFGMALASGSTAQLFSRIVFDTPVAVAIDQFIQTKYTLVQVLGAYRVSEAFPLTITGWPHSYAIQSITSNGTYWDVVVDSTVNDHYATGRTFTIAGALPATTAISSISSTASDFTVTTATAHGKTAGQSIVIAGATPAGYNGTWTVLSAGTNTIVVTSAANLGAGSGGTVRLTTPATWYDGTHTIASFPNATTIRITNANSITAAGIAGTAKNSLAANGIISGWAFFKDSPYDSGARFNQPADCSGSTALYGTVALNVIAESAMKTGMAYGATTTVGAVLVTKNNLTTTNDLNARTSVSTWEIASGEAVSKTIRQLALSYNAGAGILWITFDERQRKDNGYKLTLALTQSWDPELT